MIKQRGARFRIRKCRRIKGKVAAQLCDQESMDVSHDEHTEIREGVNEWVDEQHHDLEKELQLPMTKHLNGPSGETQPHIKEVEYQLPTLMNNKNPEVVQLSFEQNQAKQQLKVEQINQNNEISLPLENQMMNIPSMPKLVSQTITQNANCIQQIKQMHVPVPELTQIHSFAATSKGPTIFLNQSFTVATQTGYYWQNNKLILSEPVKTRARAIFKVANLKYCVGMGMAIKEITQKHEYNYKSYQNELSHGLFLITSQGYSWSHAYKSEDDCFRADFKKIKNHDRIEVLYERDSITFTLKQASFTLSIPDSVRQKYTLCFCAYLHEKLDSISLESTDPLQKDERTL